MGRRYTGDINGKFAFAMQSSDCADRFGADGTEPVVPAILEYSFDEEDLESVEKELESIKLKYGKKINKIDLFFKENSTYTDNMVAEYLGLEEKKTRDILKEYFDYKIGIKIRDCIKDSGQCSFEAEM